MKVINKEIDCVSVFLKGNNTPIPLKIRLKNNRGEYLILNIDKVLSTHEEKKAGNRISIYSCQIINKFKNEIRPIEVRFDKESLRWSLYKI